MAKHTHDLTITGLEGKDAGVLSAVLSALSSAGGSVSLGMDSLELHISGSDLSAKEHAAAVQALLGDAFTVS